MLKTLRKQKGLTQSELGDICGISQSYISDLEKKHFVSSPTITKIISLSKVLEIEPLQLADYFIKKEINSKIPM